MQATLDAEIRGWLARYLGGEVSLQEFEDWLIPVAWSLDPEGHSAAEDIAYEIELRLAEFTNNHWTEPELRDMLRPLAAQPAPPPASDVR